MSLNQLTHSPKEQSSIYIPPELRTQIFQDLLSIPRNVKIFWSEHTQKFYTNAPIPPLLLVSHDSRLLALSHYTLAFGNPGKCRIFFSYTHDTADFQWSYLARYSGSGVNYEVMRTKLGRGDYDGLRRIRLTERELTGRATDTFVDLRGLEGLSDVFVTCDREEKEVNRGWSEGILGELWKGLEEDVRNWGKGKEKWPRLWCGRCTSEKGESGSECSRHCESPYFSILLILGSEEENLLTRFF
jgi:hypothetical protein